MGDEGRWAEEGGKEGKTTSYSLPWCLFNRIYIHTHPPSLRRLPATVTVTYVDPIPSAFDPRDAGDVESWRYGLTSASSSSDCSLPTAHASAAEVHT